MTISRTLTKAYHLLNKSRGTMLFLPFNFMTATDPMDDHHQLKGGDKRFRRRAMESWLGNAELGNTWKEAGVTDPYWVPPPGWKLGDSPNQDPLCSKKCGIRFDGLKGNGMLRWGLRSKVKYNGNHRRLSTHSHPTYELSYTYFSIKYSVCQEVATILAEFSASLKNPQTPDTYLSFLKEKGFSSAQLERLVLHHRTLLSTSPEETIIPKIKLLCDLGLTFADAIGILGRDIIILTYHLDKIRHHIVVLERLLGSRENVAVLLKKRGSVLYVKPETILKNVTFLRSCGLHTSQIMCYLLSVSFVFTISEEALRRCVLFVDEMGIKRSSAMYIHAIRAISTMSDQALKLKLQTFRDLGFADDIVSKMFRAWPGVLTVSTKKLKQVTELLIESGRYDISSIAKNPAALMTSVENRYKPRIKVLTELEKKGLITKWPSLSILSKAKDDDFKKRWG